MNRHIPTLLFFSLLLSSSCSHPSEFTITKIQCYDLKGSRHSVVAPNAYIGTRSKTGVERIVLLETSIPGLIGLGTTLSETPTPTLRRLLGKDPREFFIMRQFTITAIKSDQEKAAYALRGVDLGILDLIGKYYRKPVADLWGPRHRNSVETYDSSLYFEDLLEDDHLNDYPFPASSPLDRLAKKAQWLTQEKGFHTIKIKVGRPGQMKRHPNGVHVDIDAVTTVRKAVGPDVGIFVDGNNGYHGHPEWVLQFARGVREQNIIAMEEMIPENSADYAKIRKELRQEGIPVVIAEGESLREYSAEWEKTYLQSGLVDWVQPDLKLNGILGVRRWAEAAARHGARLVCHNFGNKMGVYASVHVALSSSNSHLVESDDMSFPAIQASGLILKDGHYFLSGKPGLGVEIDSEALTTESLRWTLTR